MPKRAEHWFTALLLLLLGGCGGQPDTGPVDIKWDRQACERCRMVLSDRHFSAQIRGGPGHRPYFFDDFGCAVLWLEEQPWKDDPGVEFWVADHRTGAWLDARKAYYRGGRHTPMAYGLGAEDAAGEGMIDYEQAVRRVHEVEEGFNRRAQELREQALAIQSQQKR
jgi:nitrous oxide reductase accessory protein NosL